MATHPIGQYVSIVDENGNAISPTTGAVTIADGADVTQGVTTGAAVITDANGTIQQYLRGIIKLLIAFITIKPAVGAAPTNVTSTALEASHVIKATPGTLYGLSGFNNKASAQYIQIFDSATVPADTAVPVATQLVPGTTPYAFDYGIYGRGFATGIAVSNSSTLATKTIGSADCWYDAQFV